MPRSAKAATKLDASSAPANVKTEFAAFRKEFGGVRARFGVTDVDPAAAAGGGRGGRGGGGGGRGGAVDTANVFGRVGSVKDAIMGIWEVAE